MVLHDFPYPPISTLHVFFFQNQIDIGGYGFECFLNNIDICQFPLVTRWIRVDMGGYRNQP